MEDSRLRGLMYLLDTNVVSELRRGKSNPAAEVRRWAGRVQFEHLYLSSVTVLELEVGALRMERRDARQGAILRTWLQAVLEEFQYRILPFGTKAAVLCAAMHVPDRRPERDAMIAATAKEHGYTVVTRNSHDFERCGVPVLNPWFGE